MIWAMSLEDPAPPAAATQRPAPAATTERATPAVASPDAMTNGFLGNVLRPDAARGSAAAESPAADGTARDGADDNGVVATIQDSGAAGRAWERAQ